MRQVTVILAATSFLALGLACGGGGGGLGLSGGSARAKELCAHLDGANASKWNPGVSCTALAVGTERAMPLVRHVLENLVMLLQAAQMVPMVQARPLVQARLMWTWMREG